MGFGVWGLGLGSGGGRNDHQSSDSVGFWRQKP